MKSVFGPIYWIAKTTVGEAIRRKVLLVILLIGLAGVVIAPGMNILSARSELSAVKSLTLGIIQMTAALIAIVLTVYMIPNEIERRTIYTILSKPVQRYQFVIGKYFGAVSALALMVFLMTLVMILAVGNQLHWNSAEVTSLAKGPLLYFFQMALLAAVAMMFSTFVSPLVNFFLSSGIFIMGTVFGSIFQTFTESRDTAALTKMLATGLRWVLPNFSQYNVSNPLINSGQVITSESIYYMQSIGYAFAYIGGLLALACIIFERREV